MGGRDCSLPTVHLQGAQYHLIVYHAINSTLLLLLSSPPSPLLYSDLDTQLGPALSGNHRVKSEREYSGYMTYSTDYYQLCEALYWTLRG